MTVRHVSAPETPGLRPETPDQPDETAATPVPEKVPASNSTESISEGEIAPARAPMAEISGTPDAPAASAQAEAPGTEQSTGAVDYYAIISNTIAGLAVNDAENRGSVYEHAREIINQRLRDTRPGLSSRMIAVEQIAFDRAIKKIEAEQRAGPTIPRMPRAEALKVSATPDQTPPDIAPPKPAADIPTAKDRAPAVVVAKQRPAPPVQHARNLPGGALRLFAIAGVIVAGLLSYGLARGHLTWTGMRDAARTAVGAPAQPTSAADDRAADVAAASPSIEANEQSSADHPAEPEAPAATAATPSPAEQSADGGDTSHTPYITQLASFLSLCRPAQTAYGNDPCGNLQPRPFGGPGVTPRKAPEWVAMYDGLAQAIPARRVKNPTFTIPAPAPVATDAPANGTPASSQTVHSADALAREKFAHGVDLASADNLDDAIADFSEAIRLDPKLADAYVQRGQAMFKNGNADSAIADFSQALQIDPRHATAYKARGMTRLYKSDDDGAISDLSKAIQYAELDPASIPPAEVFYARRSRATLYDRKQLYDRELADLNAMIDGYWKNPGLAAALKSTYREQGAATLLASIYRLRALVHQKRSNLDNAIGDLSFAIQLDPQRALPFLIERARLLEAAGRKDQAVADYQQALALSPANTDVKNALERAKRPE